MPLMTGWQMRISIFLMPSCRATSRPCDAAYTKERAIVNERIHMAMGGFKENPNVIEVIDIACDECPMGGYEVTESCRGCLAHRCEDVCPVMRSLLMSTSGLILIRKNASTAAAAPKACPYSAIINKRRPCEIACKVDAISTSAESKAAQIDNSKCISCGACVYMCPWGAIVDKSFITDVVKMLKESENNQKYKVYAVVAPSISGQFSYAKLGQVITAIKKLGFHSVVEVALGADMVAYSEAAELAEKGFLTSSCCPAFVDYIHKNSRRWWSIYPTTFRRWEPLASISRALILLRKLCLLEPCTAKRWNFKKESVSPYIDSVLTFEELQALFDSRIWKFPNWKKMCWITLLITAVFFARSGGLSDAVAQALKEQNLDFEAKTVACDGIEACRMALLKASKNVLPGNFIEGMACVGGCIGWRRLFDPRREK